MTLLSEFDPRHNDKFIENQSPEWRAMYEYSLNDEYTLWDSPVDTIYYKMTGSGSRTWGYMPPDKFKILLYFPDDNSFIVSERLERYAFTAYYTADISGGKMNVTKNGGAAGISVELGSLLLRIAITVLLEVGVARLFGYQGNKVYKLLIIMNLCTQLFLNIMIAAGDLLLGGLGGAIACILAEPLIVVIEAVVYASALPRLTELKTRGGRAVGYAFAANAASFFIGGFLLLIGEMIFSVVVNS